MLRTFAIDIAMRLLFVPYMWGGDDPLAGFDCSGFVIEVLKSVGKLPATGDWTADGLSKLWPQGAPLAPGALVFYDWNKDGRIDHVEMVLHVESAKEFYTVAASGGDSSTSNLNRAIATNAYLKIRPGRPEYSTCVDPFSSPRA